MCGDRSGAPTCTVVALRGASVWKARPLVAPGLPPVKQLTTAASDCCARRSAQQYPQPCWQSCRRPSRMRALRRSWCSIIEFVSERSVESPSFFFHSCRSHTYLRQRPARPGLVRWMPCFAPFAELSSGALNLVPCLFEIAACVWEGGVLGG